MKRYRCALAGMLLAAKTSQSLRIQLAAAVHVVLFGFWQGLSAVDWAIELLCCAVVLSLETANSAIERLADRVTREQDRDIGAAKDMAAGAVLTAALFSAAVWAVILFAGAGGRYRAVLFALLGRHVWPWLVLAATAALSAIWIYSIGRKKT